MEDMIIFSIRIKRATADRLRHLAKDDCRTRNNFIRKQLEELTGTLDYSAPEDPRMDDVTDDSRVSR